VETTRDVKERIARDEAKENRDLLLSSSESFAQVDEGKPKIAKTNEKDGDQQNQTSTSRIEALRAKLHSKLAEHRSRRPLDPSAISKRAARRAAKQLARDKKRQGSNSSTMTRPTAPTQYTLASSLTSSVTTPAADLAQMDFGRLAGLNPTPKNYANNKALANIDKKKNLAKLVADAELKQKQLDEWKRSADEADKAKHQKALWSDAIQEASGDRVKDDPAKLRKALKQKLVKKERSAKAWKSRIESTKQKLDERQRIRGHNLSQRKLGGSLGSNLSSKKIVTANDEKSPSGKRDDGESNSKSSSRRPPPSRRAGFEGKKNDYINNHKPKSATPKSKGQ
jgi:Surfeit locus protein 6